jgi:hypothetical protein
VTGKTPSASLARLVGVVDVEVIRAVNDRTGDGHTADHA